MSFPWKTGQGGHSFQMEWRQCIALGNEVKKGIRPIGVEVATDYFDEAEASHVEAPGRFHFLSPQKMAK